MRESWTRRQIIAFVAAIALCGVVVFALIKPDSKNSQVTSQNTGSVSSKADSPVPTAPQERTFSLGFRERKLVVGPQTLKVVEGDEVRIRVLSDQSEELHIHGYDIALQLEANVENEISFRAILTGRFPYELERSKQHVGTLEVVPR